MDLNDLKKMFNTTNLSDLKSGSNETLNKTEDLNECVTNSPEEPSNKIDEVIKQKLEEIDNQPSKKKGLEGYIGNSRYDSKEYPYAVSDRNRANRVVNDIEIVTTPKSRISRTDKITYINVDKNYSEPDEIDYFSNVDYLSNIDKGLIRQETEENFRKNREVFSFMERLGDRW